jgi:transcriptional regulator with XRE-family HTH domain
MRLQRLRQAAGMSQPQLAKAASIPLGTLRNLEQGRRDPLLSTAARLARALNITVDALVPADEPAAEAPAPKRRKPKGDAT